MRKLLTIHGQHHPKADVDHMYVPRKQEGMGQMQLEEAYTVEITKLVEYVDRKEDPPKQIVRMHQNIINSTMLQTDTSRQNYRGTRQVMDSIAEETKERWQWKRKHRQLPCNLHEKLMDNK